MSQAFNGLVQTLQAKGLAVKEENRIDVLVILAAALERNPGLTGLVVIELHGNLVIFALVKGPWPARVNGRRLEFISKRAEFGGRLVAESGTEGERVPSV
jgi:hypothetical protein